MQSDLGRLARTKIKKPTIFMASNLGWLYSLFVAFLHRCSTFPASQTFGVSIAA
jgi:hypothetical protein